MSTYRLFNESGERISTAVVLKSGSLLQVFPTKQEVSDEAAWKALHPTCHELRKETKKEKVKKAKASTEDKWAAVQERLAAEAPHVKLVRAYMDEYLIEDNLTEVGSYKGPMRLYVLLEDNLYPVFFNRATGAMKLQKRYGELITEFPSEPLAFFGKIDHSFKKLSLSPLPEDKKTVVIVRQGFSYGQELRASSYLPEYYRLSAANEKKRFEAAKAEWESLGFHVKVIRPLEGFSTQYNKATWQPSLNPLVKKATFIMSGF